MIGFPIVWGPAAYCVEVEIAPNASDSAQAFWNGKQLASTPFSDHNLNDPLKELLQAGLDVRFLCPEVEAPSGTRVNIPLGGPSAQVCFSFLGRYEPTEPGDQIRLMITGRLDHQTPAPLKSAMQIEQKARKCQNESYNLLLHAEDADLLSENQEFKESCLDIPPGMSRAELLEKLGSRRTTVYASLPSGDRWHEDLARLLGFRPRTPSDATVSQKAGPERRAPVATPEGPSLRSLLEAALPADKQHLVEHLKPDFDITGAIRPGSLAEHAYKEQQRLFTASQDTPLSQHVILGGPTSSGKTTVAKIMLLNAVMRRQSAIYVAPTRMLTYSVHKEFRAMLSEISKHLHFNPEEEIVVSTGERNQDDWRIQRGAFKVAFIVYEKANLFLNSLGESENKGVLSPLHDLTLIIVDEVHMLADHSRGGILDLFLAKALGEADRRADQENNDYPLRVVAITTEQENDSALNAMLTLQEDFKPLVLSSSARPLAVKHILQPWEDGFKIDPVSIGAFSSQAQRELSEAKRNEITDEVKDSYNAKRRIAGGGEWGLFDVVQEHLRGSKRAILAGASVHELLTTYGKKLFEDRKGLGDSEDIQKRLKDPALPERDRARLVRLDRLCKLIESGDISEQEGRILKERAATGIFYHYSGLDYRIREWMEEAFCKSEPLDGKPLVLLATETLTYGVNLPADRIILLDLYWPRIDPYGKMKPLGELTSNQYHNLLGRVGRLGKVDEGMHQQAVVLIDCRRGNIDRDLRIVTDWYRPRKGCECSTIIKKDQENARLNSIEDLASVSYSAFRACLDAVRFAGLRAQSAQYARVKEVQAVLRKSFYWHKELGGRHTEEQSLLLLGSILKLATQYPHGAETDTPRLVEKLTPSDIDKYRLTEHGAALIDTGTHWKSIPLLDAWLRQVRHLPREHAPVEMLLLGLAATQDLWVQMRAFCEETNNRFAYAEEQTRAWSAKVLGEELKKLPRMESAEIQQILQSFEGYISESCADIHVNDGTSGLDVYKAGILMRLSAALLQWIRGEETGAINRLHRSKEPDDNGSADADDVLPRSFSPRYAFKASWLAIMCLRFFVKMQNKLLAEHERELPMLALRLRHGLPAAGIPFFKQGGGLTRKLVMTAINKGVSAAETIAVDNPALSIERKLGEANRQIDAEDLVDNVFHYYLTGAADLYTTLSRRDDAPFQEIWPSAGDFLSALLNVQTTERSSLGSEGSMRRSGEGLPHITDGHLKQASNLLCDLVLPNREGLDAKGFGSGAIGLNLIQGSRILKMCLANPKQTEIAYTGNHRHAVVVRVPWKSGDLCEFPEVSLFGAITLAFLLRRSSIPMDDVLAWAAKAEKRLHTIKDLFGQGTAINRGSIPGEILEKLLIFDEPVGKVNSSSKD